MLKKSTLIVLAVCLIVGGIGISVAGLALGGESSLYSDDTGIHFRGWNEEVGYRSDRNDLEVIRTQAFNGDVKSVERFSKIDVTSGTVAINIQEGNDYAIRMNVGSKVELNYGVRGDTLYIEQEGDKMKWGLFGNHSMSEYSGEIVITIPSGTKLEKTTVMLGVGEGNFKNITTEKFNLIAGVASTNIEGLNTAYASIEGGVGEVNLEGSNLGEAKITMGVGSVRIETALEGDMEIEGGLGDLEIILEGREEDYNYQISRGAGEIEINDQHYNGLGDVNILNRSDQTIDIEAGIGSIKIATR